MPKFLLTPELARLARWLRVLGFDAALAMSGNITGQKRTCDLQNRILLTRMHKNAKLRHISHLLCITSDHYPEQLRQVVSELGLKEFSLFSRCLYCNRAVRPVTKAAILDLLPEKVRLREENFTRCPRCHRIYWPGDHYQAMLRFLKQTLSPAIFNF